MRVLAGLCIVTQLWTVTANVEKTVFLGPRAVTLPNVRPSLDDLGLHTLSPVHKILPTQLHVQFPATSTPRGLESWYLLWNLEEGRRYEVRVCWPATVSSRRFLSGTVANPPATDRLLARHVPCHPSIRYPGTHIVSCRLQQTP
jgi:hypothetical protein